MGPNVHFHRHGQWPYRDRLVVYALSTDHYSLYCDIERVCGLGRGKDRIEMEIYSLALYLAVGKMGSFSLMTLGS